MPRRHTTRADRAAIATIAHPIATTGELFADGSTIELIGSAQDGNPRLMLWNGRREVIGSMVEHKGRRYEPALINSSVMHELSLPTQCSSHGNTREFLATACKLIANFGGLEEQPAALVGRMVLCSGLIDAVSVAPALMIIGPDTARADRLVALLHCLCRHALPLISWSSSRSVRTTSNSLRFCSRGRIAATPCDSDFDDPDGPRIAPFRFGYTAPDHERRQGHKVALN